MIGFIKRQIRRPLVRQHCLYTELLDLGGVQVAVSHTHTLGSEGPTVRARDTRSSKLIVFWKGRNGLQQHQGSSVCWPI